MSGPGQCPPQGAASELPSRLGLSEAAERFGMTARTLRICDAEGLVVARRDRRNARWFDRAGTRRLQWIAAFRRAGLRLAQIKAILLVEGSGGNGAAVAILDLERRQRVLQLELAAGRKLLTQLKLRDQRLLQMDAPSGMHLRERSRRT
jgi:DNA-binding transcriptional MerR regulator